jgi:recombinational DNA repair ATPase RecF
VEIWAAEEEGSELRPLHGAQASLSGGWRTTVVILCVLAALQAQSATPLLLLDEVGASLDEERLAALGRAFARLAERRGLQTILSLPSRTQVEAVAEFSGQQVGFLRPFADEPLAPPPHVVAALRRVA